MKFFRSATQKLLFGYWNNAEFQLIALAVLLSVMCITSVLFLAQGVKLEVEERAGALLGGDRMLSSSTPIGAAIEKARQLDLKSSELINFFSVLVHKDALSLAEVQAVDANYPLKGTLKIASELLGSDSETQAVPSPGTIWLEPKLFSLLNLDIGDTLQIGSATFQITQVLTLEPDKAFRGFNLAPRALINIADVARTEILQPGSRVTYKLLLSGGSTALEHFDLWIRSNLAGGQKYVDQENNQSTLKALIGQVERYFGLIVILNIGIAGVAIAIAARLFSQKQQNTVALLRCFGASFQWIFSRYLISLLLLSLFASGLGVFFGFLLYRLIGLWFLSFFSQPPQTAFTMPILLGSTMGLILLLGFVLPFLINLRHAKPLSIFRKEYIRIQMPGKLLALFGLTILFGLTLLFVSDVELLFSILVALIGINVGTILILSGLLRWIRKVARRIPIVWRFGILNIARRSDENAIQLFAFSLVIALFLIAFLVRTDLLRTWLGPMAQRVPNYFSINIPPKEVHAFQSFLKQRSVDTAAFYPIVGAQLISVNEEPVSMDPKSSAKRVMERLLNVTWSMELQNDNSIIEGKWFDSTEYGKAVVSLEKGFAQRLSITPGDILKFQIGEKILTATVISIRQVAWDSFNPNFFVIFPSGILEEYPNTVMTSFYLGKKQLPVLKEIMTQFPMVSIIDVETVLTELRSLLNAMIHILQTLFGVTFLMSIILMSSTLLSSLSERKKEKALLRMLGANSQQLIKMLLAEFLLLGLLAGMIATLIANLFTFWLEHRLLMIPFHFNLTMLWLTPFIGMLIIGLGGCLGSYLQKVPLRS